MDLTPHEKKILALVESYPKIVNNSKERAKVAAEHGLSEKTLRNRIGELKRQGLIGENRKELPLEKSVSDISQLMVLDPVISPILRHKKHFLITWFIVALSISVTAINLPKWYEGKVVILPPPNESSQFNLGGLLGVSGLDVFSNKGGGQERFLAILKSDLLLKILSQKFDFQSKYGTKDSESTLKILRKKISIIVEDENQIIVSILDRDQLQVAHITNESVRILDSLNIVLNNTQARNSRMFIEARVNEVLDSLQTLEIQLTEFMEDEGVLSLPDQVTVGVQQAAEMKAIISAKEVELSVAEQMMDSNQPFISQLRHELIQLKTDYAKFFNNDKTNQLLPSFSDVPELVAELTRLQRSIEYHIKLLEFLGPQYEQAKIDELKDIPTLQVLDWAGQPEKPARPRKVMTILGGFILGLIIAYFAVYIREFKFRYYL